MSINKENYEEWMVAFMDNELSDTETVEFSNFLNDNPELKSELESFEKIQFKPETTAVYDDKEALYQKVGTLTLLKKAWPIAAAIILFFAVWPFITKDNSVATKLVGSNKIEKTKEGKEETNPIEKVAPLPKKETIKVAPKQIVAQETPATIPSKKIIANRLPSKVIAIKEKQEKKKNVKEPINIPEQKIVVQEKQTQEQPEPIVPTKKVEKEIAAQQIKIEDTPTPAPPVKTNTQIVENNNALVVINEVSHPRLYKKLNSVVTEVEEKIETIKELKRKPITVSIGKRKLFTINN